MGNSHTLEKWRDINDSGNPWRRKTDEEEKRITTQKSVPTAEFDALHVRTTAAAGRFFFAIWFGNFCADRPEMRMAEFIINIIYHSVAYTDISHKL